MGFRIESSLTNLNGKPSLAPPPIVVVRNCCFRNTFSSKLTFYLLLLTYLSKRGHFSHRVGYQSTPIFGDHRYLFFRLNHWFSFFGPSLFRIRWSQSFHRLCSFIRVSWILLLGDGITIPRLDLAVKMLTMVERIRIGAADIRRRRTRPAHIQIRPASAACC